MDATPAPAAQPPRERPLPDPDLDAALQALRSPRRRSWIGLFVLSLVAYLAVQRSSAPLQRALVLAAVVLVHELGHALAMRALGYRDVQVFFIPFFGALTSGRAAAQERWKQAVVSLAGPVPGIVLAAGVFLSPLRGDPLWHEVAWLAVVVNAFNLLPLGFLDGGRLLDALLFQRHRVLEAAFAGLSAVAFLGLAVATGDWVVGAIGLLSLVGVPFAFRRATAAARLRGRLQAGDVAALPPEELEVLHRAAVELAGSQAKPAVRAETMRQLHARATVAPASLPSTVALTAAWLVSVVLAAAAGIAGARPSLAEKPRPTIAGGPTTPAFRWVDGTRARVRIRRHAERTRDGAPAISDSTFETAFTAARRPDGGWSVAFDRSDAPVRPGAPDARFVEAVGRHGYGALSISPDGFLEAVHLTSEVRTALDATLAGLPEAASPEQRAARDRMLEGAAQSPMLELWQVLVAIVPRERLEVGVERVVAQAGENPVTGASLHGAFACRLEGRVACGAAPEDGPCVLVTYRELHDPEALARESREHLLRIGVEGGADASLTASSEGFVVFEEATLFPRIGYQGRTVTVTSADGTSTSREQVRIEVEPVR